MEIETIKKTQMETILEVENIGKNQESQMQASPTEYKRQKREYQVQKVTQKALTQQSTKMQNARDPKHQGNFGHNEKTKPKINRYLLIGIQADFLFLVGVARVVAYVIFEMHIAS